MATTATSKQTTGTSAGNPVKNVGQPAEPSTDRDAENAADTTTPAGFFIRSRSPQGFRRAGCGFNPKGAYYAKTLFSADQIETLKKESELIVEACDIDSSETTWRQGEGAE